MQVEFFFDLRPLVIGEVDLAGEFNEALIKFLQALFITDIILYFPQGFVNLLQLIVLPTGLR